MVMLDGLTHEQLMLQEAARRFVDEEMLPHEDLVDREGEVPLDPWGNVYEYRFPSSNVAGFEIISFGADGREGGSGEAADVSS